MSMGGTDGSRPCRPIERTNPEPEQAECESGSGSKPDFVKILLQVMQAVISLLQRLLGGNSQSAQGSTSGQGQDSSMSA